MNYNSLDNLLNTTENMAVLRNNSKQDDGVDTVTGVDWFKFNNIVCSNLYLSGNSYIGFGSNTAHLKICNRDGAMYYLYREEGTLFNYYKFLKIRWEGYSYYSSTSIDYKLVWELFLFDTGDMFVNVIQVPTNSSYLGTSTVLSNSVNTSLGIELGTPVMIAFYHDDENGIAWTIKKEQLNIPYPFDVKYLVRSEGKYYTLINGIQTEVNVDQLNAEAFKNQGFNKPDSFDFLAKMINPDLLSWIDTDIDVGNVTMKCVATPHDQIITTKTYDITDSSILGIDKITLDCENALFQFSFNNGDTFEILKNDTWVNTYDEWMSKEEVTSITNDKFDIKKISEYVLKIKLVDFGFIKSIVVKYRNGV